MIFDELMAERSCCTLAHGQSEPMSKWSLITSGQFVTMASQGFISQHQLRESDLIY